MTNQEKYQRAHDLRNSEKLTAKEACKKAGVKVSSYYNWHQKYAKDLDSKKAKTTTNGHPTLSIAKTANGYSALLNGLSSEDLVKVFNSLN